MAHIKTSQGILEYRSRLPYLNGEIFGKKDVLDNLRLFTDCLNRKALHWGVVGDTLINVVRHHNISENGDYTEFYILKEEEESFKDILRELAEIGFELTRYERRGAYYLHHQAGYIKVSILTPLGGEIRERAGEDFIPEKYIQNTVETNICGLSLRIPEEVEGYLATWPVVPSQGRLRQWISARVHDSLPDCIYDAWLLRHRRKNFRAYKARCAAAGIPLPMNLCMPRSPRRRHKKVLTVGVYDLLHRGHVELYRRAKGLGDHLIVAAQDGDFILKYKPTATIMNSTEDRKYLIASIRYVDEVITYTDVDKIVQEVDFDIFVTGPDQCHAGFQRAIHWCLEHGKEHVILTRTEGVSSSELKAKAAANP